MMIDRLGGIDPLKNVQNTQKPQKVSGAPLSDSISVSAEAKELSEVYFAMEAAGASPDVRTDRVAEVMEKMKDPAYINKAVIDIVADRLMDVYGI
ncbi:flagellar biosynthesis anti-sigma factor FlgM [Brucepastera parasyntrophica]|uniref:flagellar biosynthesis anti-sigma factor FlgM n=1 Tax=Brucepastera parasyntrophica TaxID=2880008 RepID=UPI00210B50F8|nr:flagellar biosynthesis anti-sigma factor FlgM [Brucepastera parasyntrophica]ULQ58980.1 flagellar biosynthesis anti-sigma factor FlgM [Brucepastera parasyntrophica]